MIPYWFLFLIPVFGTLQLIRVNIQSQNFGFLFFSIVAILMIGLRYEIGADWFAYMEYYEISRNISFLEALQISDPGYMAINWLSAKFNLGIWGVNLFCASVFVYGLIKFCKQQPLSWLALLVATPYLLVVVAMGYTRQATAMGFVFLAFLAWIEGNLIKYVILIIFSSLFHISALVMLVLAPFINSKYSLFKKLLIISLFSIILLAILIESFHLIIWKYSTYIEEKLFDSKGGLIRIIMNAIPSIILLVFQNHYKRFPDYKLWYIISGISLLFIPLVKEFSTFTDRIALYMSPIQIVVFSRFHRIIGNLGFRTFVVLGIILLYALVLFVWLNYAIHSEYWVPYRWIFS